MLGLGYYAELLRFSRVAGIIFTLLLTAMNKCAGDERKHI